MENVVDHFVPRDLDVDLIRLLDDEIAGRPLPDTVQDIFHHVNILDFHPANLYEEYRKHEEAGYIYFFDHRDYQTAGPRPARATEDGRWKASKGGKVVMCDGVVVGYKLTMVFFHKDGRPGKPDRKTDWALDEYTSTNVGPDHEVETLALYRLYKMG